MHREDAEALRCLAGEETSFQWEGGSQFKSGQITRLRQGEKCCSLSKASSSDSEMPVLFLFFFVIIILIHCVTSRTALGLFHSQLYCKQFVLQWPPTTLFKNKNLAMMNTV